ncbi:hypothetical protein T4E_7010, partial [Trichinella pseudospiralis]
LTISRANDDKLRRFPTIKLSLFMTVCIMTTLTSKLQWRHLVKAGFWVIFFSFPFFILLLLLLRLSFSSSTS